MSRRRRGNGEGSVSQRKDGLWEARQYVVMPGGQRKRLSGYGRTAAAAREALAVKVRRVGQGRPATDSSVTLGDWLDTWQATTLAASDRRPGTQNTYRCVLRLYVVPAIGSVRLRDLRAHHVEALLASMSDKAGSTRRLAVQALRQALDTAVRDGLVGVNVCEQVQRPRQTPVNEARWYRPDEVRRLLNEAEGERFSPLLVTVAYLGLRIGEALALRWQDVDMDAGTLTVSGTLSRDGSRTLSRSEPKSSRSHRTLPMPEPVRAALAEQRRRQAAERLLCGESWRGTDAVFGTRLGGWTEPRTASRWYSDVARRAAVEGSWHTLRHSAATTLLTAGVPMRVVSDILGHADVRTTLAIYGHVGSEHLEEAVSRMEKALRQPIRQ